MKGGEQAVGKNNRGFTLIELMIAIAVLSVMASVLFQTFALSGGIATKSRREERLQEIAKQTMEGLKGYSFAELGKAEKEDEEGNGTGKRKVVLGGTEYELEPLPSGTDYLLSYEYRRNKASLKEKADYLIEALVDWGIYSVKADGENQDSPYTINQYRMPNIVDVSSFQNVVIDPNALIKDDELRMGELLLKVNQKEVDEENIDTATENEPVYTEDNIIKFLHVDLSEKTGDDESEDETMIVKVNAVYTVDQDTLLNPPLKVDEFSGGHLSDMTIATPVISAKRQIIKDKKTGKSMNRLYLFLPEYSELRTQMFERIYVTADTKEVYEVYVVAAGSGLTKDDYILLEEKKKEIRGDGERVELYTNLRGAGNKQDQPISYDEAERRLYHLTVTIYEAIYEADYDGDGGLGDMPVRGAKVLELDSTKSE